MKNFYLTTAIDYANGSPHLGHAYEKILADVIARTKRLQGEEVHFLTGLDEHGQKVQQGAESEGIDPQTRCDKVAEEFIDLLGRLNISNNDYIRTTEERHRVVVTKILQDLFDKGEIYQAEYKGFYSTRAEQFLQEKKIKLTGHGLKSLAKLLKLPRRIIFLNLVSIKSGWSIILKKP